MEVDYLIERLGKYLGGIDVEKVKASLVQSSDAAFRILGLDSEPVDVSALECRRVATFLEVYKEEEKRLRALYRELKALGISPSDLETLRRRIKAAKRNVKIYRDMAKRCSSQVSIFTSQTPELQSSK
ncbi:hypothetical protein [Pyrobaculum calidifontis]|uniref:Uncharacterized protein n=1 Tax=Pyrobaculum calidifontis (strain DSM 21063 / JCM 11548 / VA1) TaxID=410359 RepID=A3MX36_PYRCJ|nr:hypothetical protein [Pyrobaculum calidifontis]ABO09203.1 conserved hypothetical protein [Pyrobaculum calidifontis JCM 11548]